MTYIQNFLENLTPLKPIPTSISSVLTPVIDSVKAVIFDIYGTLMISATGDIDGFDVSGDIIKQSLVTAGMDIQPYSEDELDELCCGLMKAYLVEIRLFHQKVKDELGFPFPEVDIITLWDIVFKKHEKCIGSIDNIDLECFAFSFEVLSNMVYPMPGLRPFLKALSKTSLKLGIVSNAQYYTPIIMNYFLTKSVSNSEYIHYFDPELTVYSYKHLRAKPDTFLFKKIKTLLAARDGIQPDEVLYVGNDMYKDILPASRVGFKTVLYAGDQRSLRLLEDKEAVKSILPDYCVTNLLQLMEMINI